VNAHDVNAHDASHHETNRQPELCLELDLDIPVRAVACDLTNTDDRDLLIIEENPTDIVVSAPTYEATAERREYPYLFNTLRQER
jgi:hypothetical protein